ncbi:MAG: hypothetical protein Q8N85_05340 [Candidatus Omnitrophota bacterium]|nr:hypothetical protein [Candidatus Omnitrophota bacterium]
MPRKNSGQEFSEYSLLMVIVVAALVGMFFYLARSVQQKYRQGADSFAAGEQYVKGSQLAAPSASGALYHFAEVGESHFSCSQLTASVRRLEDRIYGCYYGAAKRLRPGFAKLIAGANQQIADLSKKKQDLQSKNSLPSVVVNLQGMINDWNQQKAVWQQRKSEDEAQVKQYLKTQVDGALCFPKGRPVITAPEKRECLF